MHSNECQVIAYRYWSHIDLPTTLPISYLVVMPSAYYLHTWLRLCSTSVSAIRRPALAPWRATVPHLNFTSLASALPFAVGARLQLRVRQRRARCIAHDRAGVASGER